MPGSGSVSKFTLEQIFSHPGSGSGRHTTAHPAHTITTWYRYLEYLCAAAPVVATHSGILSPSSHYNYLVPGVFVRSSTRCCNTLRHPLTRLTLYNNYLVPGVFVRSSTLRCYTLQHPLTRLTLYSNYLVPGVFVRSSTSCCYSEADPDPWNPYHFPGSGSKNGWIRNPDTESRSGSGSN